MEMFRHCGWASFGALAVGILATLVGVVALALGLVKPRTGFVVGVLALAMSLGAPGVGVLGVLHGRHVVEEATSGGVDISRIEGQDSGHGLRGSEPMRAGGCIHR